MKCTRRLAQFTLITSSLLSAGFTQEVQGKFCCGNFEVGGEFIALRPGACDLMYAVIDPRPYSSYPPPQQDSTDDAFPQGSLRSLDPHYAPGFRIFGAYLTPGKCADVTASYTWLHTRQRQTSKPGDGGLWPTFTNTPYIDSILFNPIDLAAFPGQLPAIARATAQFNYDAADLEVGSRRMIGCRFWGRAFAGLHFFDLHEYFQAHITGTKLPGSDDAASYNILSRRTSQSWTIGPSLGGEAIYTICGGLGIGAKAGLGIGAGNFRIKGFENIELRDAEGAVIQAERMDIFSPHEVTVVPFVHARLGINYFCCCCDHRITGEVGYEFRNYFHAIHEQLVITHGRGSDRCNSFSLNGFYARLAVQI